MAFTLAPFGILMSRMVGRFTEAKVPLTWSKDFFRLLKSENVARSARVKCAVIAMRRFLGFNVLRRGFSACAFATPAFQSPWMSMPSRSTPLMMREISEVSAWRFRRPGPLVM